MHRYAYPTYSYSNHTDLQSSSIQLFSDSKAYFIVIFPFSPDANITTKTHFGINARAAAQSTSPGMQRRSWCVSGSGSENVAFSIGKSHFGTLGLVFRLL